MVAPLLGSCNREILQLVFSCGAVGAAGMLCMKTQLLQPFPKVACMIGCHAVPCNSPKGKVHEETQKATINSQDWVHTIVSVLRARFPILVHCAANNDDDPTLHNGSYYSPHKRPDALIYVLKKEQIILNLMQE